MTLRAGSASLSRPPDAPDGGSGGGPAGPRQAVSGLDRGQHVVVRHRPGVPARLDHLTGEDERDLVTRAAVVLVPCHDEQAAVAHGPVRVRADVLPEPAVTGRDGAIVHVVA